MKKYMTPKIQVHCFTDGVSTTELEPTSPLSKNVFAAGSVNSVILNGAGSQRTTTADVKDILKFK